MRITTVLGARPQFIKAAAVSRAVRARFSERLIHTGQHYDAQMSDVFFSELDIPAPDVTLQVGSASHGAQTGRMLEAIESDLLAYRPDAVLVYGDTNSTLAGCLAAVKLHLPVIHVESGLRSFVHTMPEEINRVVTDRLSRVCCCPSESARAQLAAEGITRGVEVVGDVMLDALLDASDRIGDDRRPLQLWGVTSGAYVLATVHRAANTDDPSRLAAIVQAFSAMQEMILCPLHPRTVHALAQQRLSLPSNVRVVPPLSYLDMVRAMRYARCILTDSGGVQKEAYWLGIPCITLREETEWTETVTSGWNALVDVDPRRIAAAVRAAAPAATVRHAYGTRGAAQRVVDAIALHLS